VGGGGEGIVAVIVDRLIPSSQVSKREIDERFERGEMTFDDRRLSQDNAFAAAKESAAEGIDL